MPTQGIFKIWVSEIAFPQPSPSPSEASARKNVDVVRDWDLGATSRLKVLQNA